MPVSQFHSAVYTSLSGAIAHDLHARSALEGRPTQSVCPASSLCERHGDCVPATRGRRIRGRWTSGAAPRRVRLKASLNAISG